MCECMSVHVLDWVGGVKLPVIVKCVNKYMSILYTKVFEYYCASIRHLECTNVITYALHMYLRV